jgi:4-amino-4-deoxy-L-arabinose transferase-like glycosyltransferase
LLLLTLDQPLFTWDEGYTLRREALMRGWFQRVLNPPAGVSRSQLFSAPAISTFWQFAREEPDGHPPFYAVIGNAGWLLGQAWLPPNEVHRLGPVLLFSLTSGVMYGFLARRWGRLAGVAAAGAWVLMPRVFAHAHLASYDIPLACLWFLTVLAFWKSLEGWTHSFRSGVAWSALFAVLLALSAATKFTGLLIPLPLLVWSLAAGCRSLARQGVAASFKSVRRLCVCLALPLALVPVGVALLREVRAIEAGLQARANENTQDRAKRAAEIFRSAKSHPSNVLIFVSAAVWVATLVVLAIARGKHRSPLQREHQTRQSDDATSAGSAAASGARAAISPVAETWAAVSLVPALTVALVPNWWHDPLRGIAIFVWSSTTRHTTTWIPTQFFGTLYEFSLPWYNTLAWVALTVPPLILLFIVLGIVSTLTSCNDSGASDRSVAFRDRSLAWLLLLNAATLLVIRALPGAPGHDGERQLLGSFPFLAAVAGLGAEWLRARLTHLNGLLANGVAWGLVAVAFAWSGAAIWHFRSAPLAYYTELIGGLRGAARLGLDPTYYWDAMDRDVIDWLNANTTPAERVLFCNYPESFAYLQHWDLLKVEILPTAPQRARWYVLQNRPGLFLWNRVDRWLAEHGRPAYVRELDGVPLIWVYSIDEYERATAASRNEAQ